MKIGIIADIHGRLLSLKEALKRLNSIDLIFCLGDIAGFEPDVNECYDILKSKNIVNILGNHEFEAISNYDPDHDYSIVNSEGTSFPPDFGVNNENKIFIKQFKLIAKATIDGIKYSFCHGYPVKYKGNVFFDYLSNENILEFSKRHNSTVIFCGHIHRAQAIRAKPSEYEFLDEIEESRTILLEEGVIYGFNVGMLSRNMNDPDQLQYCVLDTIERKVDFIFTQPN